MKRNILFLIIGFVFSLSVSGQSFKEDFWTALNAKNMEKAEKTLKAWDFADSNDSELYVAYFNFYTVKSQNAGGTNGYDKEFSQKALDFITEGIERFPTRFDMRIGKVYMLCELKNFTSYTDEVIKFINYSKKIENNWKGENFRLIDKPEEMFFGSIQDFQEKLFAENNTSLYGHIIKISNEMIKVYPNYIQSRINLSTVYIAQKEYDKSIVTLLKAKETEPKNAILLYNIAYAYNLKGDKVNAKKHFELTVANVGEKEGKLKDAAQKQLNAMR